jgi:hypothetical protein
VTQTLEPPKIRPRNIADRDDIDFEQVEHLVDLSDPDTALCGVDQTDVPWEQGWPVCQGCLAISRGGMN